MIKLVILLFTALKFGKIAATGGTMALSLIIYAPDFRLGLRRRTSSRLLFAHEMGHWSRRGSAA